MKQTDFFGQAKWVGAAVRTADSFSLLQGEFFLPQIRSAKIRVLGLGFFQCYINDVPINPDTFLPLSSDFEDSCDPKDEVIKAHRIYVPEFDITEYLKEGKNTVTVHFGGGWYCFGERTFGLPKAIYRICCEDVNGKELTFVSDENCRIAKSYVSGYNFTMWETHDLTVEQTWEQAVVTEQLFTEYCKTDCPTDRLINCLPLKEVHRCGDTVVYDCGENTTGYPVLKIRAAKGAVIRVDFSEELLENGMPDPTHQHGQHYTVIANGEEMTVQPQFTWFGFRCFAVTGDATPVCVKVIHADVPVNSTFVCDNETLNWTYQTFLHTMLCNMHTGHPSDCPHLERRGYTGDGQLTCHAVLSSLDARRLYEKWMQDIGDCQDVLSGHIQYTAPYINSGGGPGGWGSAIVEVPYQLYRHYGDAEILKKYYPQMRRYIDYLEAHSEFGLVTSDKEGSWCLGDWCGPNILYPDKDITSHNQQVFLPAPFVNTYFMVKSLEKMCDIAKRIGEENDIPEYEEKIALRKKAIRAAYFNAFDNNFIMNIQGANAFAVDIGLGNEETYRNMVAYYDKLGHYDTGIFATDIVTRLLFEKGDADLAVKLLTHNGNQGFEHWRQNGATTFHEYWDSNRSRSHSHPMFGAPIAYFFEYLLGIRQQTDSAGYRDLIIAPQATELFAHMSGSMTLSNGAVAVSYQKTADGVAFAVTLPQDTKAEFVWKQHRIPLTDGENRFVLV